MQFLTWGCSSVWAADLSFCCVLPNVQGLKKISAYMKSSRYIATPIFSKMAHWSNK